MVLWFLAALLLPWIDSAFHIDPAPPVSELRDFAALDGERLLKEWKIREWTSAYEAWFNDHFGFRNGLVRSSSWIRVHLFHTSPKKDAVLGEGDWLYLGGLPQYVTRGLTPFSPEELERFRFGVQGWRDFCAHYGSQLILGLIPDKQEIYPEHLPARERLIGKQTRTEQLVRALDGAGVELVDLRAPLLAGKVGGEVFLHTDSHWNSRGAWLGYRALLDRVAKFFPAVAPFEPEATHFTRFSDSIGDLSRMICVESLSHEDIGSIDLKRPSSKREPYPLSPELTAQVVPHNTFVGGTGRKEQPTALLFRDSFTMPLADLICESFERCVVMHMRGQVARIPFVPELVARERPDVTIVFSVDRYLMGELPEEVARVGGALDAAAVAAKYRPVGALGKGGGAASFAAPCAAVPTGKRLRVDATFTNPRAAPVVVSWRPADGSEQRVGVDARAGWYRVRVYTPAVGSTGEVRVSFGDALAADGLESIEVAAEE